MNVPDPGSHTIRIHAVAAASPPAVRGAQWIPVTMVTRAPHRMLFFVGASNVLLAMFWWLLWLVDAHVFSFGSPQPPVPAGWLHAIVMEYFVLPPFIFGFLLTVFPRWLERPAVSRLGYMGVGIGLLGGQLLTLAGATGHLALLQAGALSALAGWTLGLVLLLQILWRAGGAAWHAASCAAALFLGFTGLAAYAAYLFMPDARLVFAAMKIGAFGLLLPIFGTVTHRMLPFFAHSVVRAHRSWNPLGWLAGFWLLALLHLSLEIRHGYAWLWPGDLALAALTGYWWWRNRPRASAPPLLRVLFLAYAWLPVAMMLFAVQSAWYAASGSFALGRAPAHALFVGFFGSLLVAMVTRVTQGHSGRPLALGRVAGFAFVAIQAVAVLRVVAEVVPAMPALQVLAAVGWLAAFTPWVAQSIRVYTTPRIDGKPG